MANEKITNKAPDLDGQDGESNSPTLRKILRDPEKNAEFGVWLGGRKKENLAIELASGELSPAGMDSLAEERRIFLERLAQEEEMKEGLLGEEKLHSFIVSSPELTRISELVGEDGIKEALLTVFHENALAGEGDTWHSDLFVDYTDWVKKSAGLAEKQNELDEFLENNHLSAEEAIDVRAGKNVDERKEIIKGILTGKKDLGPQDEKGRWFWKKKVWSEDQLREINQTAEEMANGLKEGGKSKTEWSRLSANLTAYRNKAKEAQQQIMESLGEVLSSEGGKEIARILMSEKKPKEDTMSFDEARKGLTETNNLGKIQAGLVAYADKNFEKFIDDHGYDFNNVDEEEKAINEFFTAYKGQSISGRKKKSGFWASIYEAIVASFLEEAVSDLKDGAKVDKKKLIINEK